MMTMKQHKPAAGRRWVEIPNEASQGMLVLESVEYNSRGNRITIRVGGGQRAAA